MAPCCPHRVCEAHARGSEEEPGGYCAGSGILRAKPLHPRLYRRKRGLATRLAAEQAGLIAAEKAATLRCVGGARRSVVYPQSPKLLGRNGLSLKSPRGPRSHAGVR